MKDKKLALSILLDKLEKAKLRKNILSLAIKIKNLTNEAIVHEKVRDICVRKGHNINEYIFMCYDCGAYELYENSHNYKGNVICHSCKKTKYRTCLHCDSLHRKNEFILTDINNKRTLVCGKCASKIVECHCGNHYISGLSGRCEICSDSETNIMPYNYVPKPKFFKVEGEKNPIYFGLEIEVDKGGKSNNMANYVVKSTKENTYVVSDGSLDDGFEIVTHPMSKKYLFNFLDYCEDNTFKKLIERGYQSEETDTCGLHIHIDRCFDSCYLDDFYRILYANKETVINLTRRDDREINRWSKIIHPSDYDDFEDYLSDDKYVALNILHSKTYEFRAPKGSLEADVIKSQVELLEFLIELTKSDLDSDNYYFKDNIETMKKYTYLYDLYRRQVNLSLPVIELDTSYKAIIDVNTDNSFKRERKLLPVYKSVYRIDEVKNHSFDILNSMLFHNGKKCQIIAVGKEEEQEIKVNKLKTIRKIGGR